MRISLMQWRSNTSCVLLNYIPHNDAVLVAEGSTACKADDYPLGRCSSNSYITVNIPDVECEQCYLQLMTVDTYPQYAREIPCIVLESESNCTTNYSCANIKILPTDAGLGIGLEGCQDYDGNLGGRWPFAESYLLQASLGGSEFSGGFARFEVDHSNLVKYNISLGNVIPVPGRDEIYMTIPSEEGYSRVQAIPVTGTSLVGELGSFDQFLKDLLLEDQLVLEIKRATGQSLYRKITQKQQNYVSWIYFPHGMRYSPSGWLTGPDFVGPSARYPLAVLPSGMCAPAPHQYAATLRDNLGVLRVLITYGLVQGERLHLDGVVISPRGSAKNISFSKVTASGQLELADFEGKFITRNYAHGTVALQSKEVPNSVSALVKISDNYTLVSSEPYRSVMTVLHDKDDLHTALGTIRLLETGDLEVNVAIINKTGERHVQADVKIKGPHPMGNFTEQTEIPVNRTESDDVGGWIGSTRITVKDSVLPHYMRLGVISLEVAFPEQTSLSSLFHAITDWLCAGNNMPICWICTFSAEGGPVDKGLPLVTPSGFMTAYKPTDSTLHYTITVRDLHDADRVTSVILQNEEKILTTISEEDFSPSAHVSKAVTAEGSLDMSVVDVNALATGNVKITVFTSFYDQGTIHGTLPKLGEIQPTDEAGTGTSSESKQRSVSETIRHQVTSVVGIILVTWTLLNYF
ncbi:uncharacterized protein LOC135479435 [Liolophura sinensis]|uniref:uncharacterized protein LOC135479435 n=1 Tax=Liolophura sinensis TaxID=3198878 RepID=UPI0031593353